MSLWILRQTLTAQEEENLLHRAYVLLPFSHVPDLSHVINPQELRHILHRLDPEAPPETLMRMQERIWTQLNSLQPGDLVAVPLLHSDKVVLGETNGRYSYHVDAQGRDEHRIEIHWHTQLIPQAAFGKHRLIFKNAPDMMEVTDKEARIKIYDQLPHSYNRFAKWKWLMGGIILLQSAAMLFGMMRK